MREIDEQVERIDLTVTSEATGESSRIVQALFTGAGGATHKSQLVLRDGETRWVSFPVKLVDGHVVIAAQSP